MVSLAVEGDFAVLGDLMDAAAEQIADVEAYVDGDIRLTFQQWVRAADGVAAYLAELGVVAGDVVAIHLRNGIDFAICYAAAVRVGAIATGLNQRLGPLEIASILDLCRPRLVVVDATVAGIPAGMNTIDVSALRDARGREPLDVRTPTLPHDPVCIIWTSGTTGTPKGAWFDHRNLAAAVQSAGSMTAAGDRRLAGLPFPHAGYMAKLWEQFAFGVTHVLSPTPWTAEEMLSVICSERINVAAAVPTQWAKLLTLPGIGDADFSHLRVGLSATAPASAELIEQVRHTLGCPLVVRYAMTESPSITGTDPDDPAAVQYRTVGRPQSGMHIAIVDEAGTPVEPGEVGRIRVNGACVMRGYWEDPEQTAAVLSSDGFLLSSDLGSIDPDGNLVLAGRVDDLYIRGGYNVYPLEVEQVLSEHPGVAQVAVVGVDAAVIGSIGVAFVVAEDPKAPPVLDDLRRWVIERLADYKAPDELVIVDVMPLTPMMKIDKRILAEQGPDAVRPWHQRHQVPETER